ncbi:DUF2306 domain-containing protein [Agaribacterium sp. ZY112]|uniref:DUF2306 domain-containing protein n=1 Tax=Agaribacterium sp. ZY112 TaxID=3233574 RepID=UPI003523D703
MSFRQLKEWKSCGLLLLLGLASVAAGFVQVTTVNSASFSSDNLSHTLPIVIHVIAGITFNLVSPFQFAAPLRRKYPKIHRATGRILIVSGMLAALTALWMNQFFADYGGNLKYSGIWAYCIIMFVAFYLAIKNILVRNVKNHRKWMMFAMASALGPATQRVVFIPVFVIFGEEVMTDLVIGSVIWFGLLANLAFVQWILFRENARAKALNKT